MVWWWKLSIPWKSAIPSWDPTDVDLTKPLFIDLDALLFLVLSSIVIHYGLAYFIFVYQSHTDSAPYMQTLEELDFTLQREIEKEAFRLELQRFESRFMEVHEPGTPLDVIKLFEDNPDLVDSILKINEGVPIFFS